MEPTIENQVRGLADHRETQIEIAAECNTIGEWLEGAKMMGLTYPNAIAIWVEARRTCKNSLQVHPAQL